MKRREMGTVDGVNGEEKNLMRRKELERKDNKVGERCMSTI